MNPTDKLPDGQVYCPNSKCGKPVEQTLLVSVGNAKCAVGICLNCRAVTLTWQAPVIAVLQAEANGPMVGVSLIQEVPKILTPRTRFDPSNLKPY